MIRLVGTVLAAAVLMLAAAVPASADDAELWRTYTAENPDVNRVGPQFERALKGFSRSPRRHWRPLARTALKLDRIAAGITTQFKRVETSSAAGAKVKKLVLLTLRYTRVGYRMTARSAKSVGHGRKRAALRAAKRADRAFALTFRYDRRARRGFKALGFSR